MEIKAVQTVTITLTLSQAEFAGLKRLLSKPSQALDIDDKILAKQLAEVLNSER
jgi:hypothetical protein